MVIARPTGKTRPNPKVYRIRNMACSADPTHREPIHYRITQSAITTRPARDIPPGKTVKPVI